jgi:tRNA-guanine family transglycosylase
MLRSHRWELQSLKYHNKKQAIYGIIHGGWFKSLRLKSTKFINAQPFDGIAIGGSLGRTKEDMYKILDYLVPLLDERPRHMLGIGWIDDLFELVGRGIDTFDCVEMTRVARHGNLYISPISSGSRKNKYRIDIGKAIFAKDKKPIDKSCNCYTCKHYSRSDIHNFYKKMRQEKDEKAKALYGKLATLHNMHFMLSLMEKIRESIKSGTFQRLKKEWLN